MNTGSLYIWSLVVGSIVLLISLVVKVAMPKVQPVRIKPDRRRYRARDSR